MHAGGRQRDHGVARACGGVQNFLFVRNAHGEAGQIMYIGSDSMLPDEMNVEDFLLYTQTGSSDRGDDNARERLEVLLSQLGMSAMQDTDLRELSYNKRILLVTLASALNPNIVCIVLNDPKFRVDADEEMLARRIFSLINNRGKCSLIACSSAYLMAYVANRVAIVKQGRLEFFGEYKKFLDDYCLGIMSFNSDKPAEVAQQLEAKYPDLSILCKEKLVYLMKRKGSPDIDLATLIKDVINLEADYNSIVMDEKSFVMACKEALGKG
jgi:ABC-type multidrug transport system ATPase subunit